MFDIICVEHILDPGIKAQSEYSTADGRIDLVLELSSRLYVIEIKFNKPAAVALAQIELRGYHEKFLLQHKPVTLLGLSFHRSPKRFNVTYALKEL